MPSKNDTAYHYKMLSDEALAKFRIFCAAGNLPSPQGAYDAKPKYAKDQAVPVSDLVTLIAKLLAENAKLKRGGMATDAAPLPPTADDIIEALTELHGLASLDMPPDKFEQTHALVARIIERVRQLQKELNRRTNAEALANGGDQPPPFKGQPQRGGAPAMDAVADFNARFPNALCRPRSTEEVLGSLRKNLDRIGVV